MSKNPQLIPYEFAIWFMFEKTYWDHAVMIPKPSKHIPVSKIMTRLKCSRIVVETSLNNLVKYGDFLKEKISGKNFYTPI